MRLPAEWNDRVRDHPLRPETFLAQVADAGVRYGDGPLCRHRRPLIIDPALHGQMQRMIAALHQVVRALRGLIEADGLDGHPDSLAVRLGLNAGALALARLAPGHHSAAVLARVDTFIENGVARVVEINAESPAGMGYARALHKVFAADPMVAGLGPLWAPDPLTSAVDAVSGLCTTPDAQLAIVDFLDVPTRPEFDLVAAGFARVGLRCRVSDVRALRMQAGRLHDGAGPIDLVLRRVLVSEILERPADCRALVEAVRTGAVQVVNTLRSSLLNSKGLLALLHDPGMQAQLPAEAVRTLLPHVPWTGILHPELGPGTPPGLAARVAADPERWVLKPMLGHGGTGVIRGWDVSAEVWAARVDQARGAVVQQRVAVPEGSFPAARAGWATERCHWGLDPFLVRGRLAGYLCRLSPGPLGNVSEGASQVPVFIQGSPP